MGRYFLHMAYNGSDFNGWQTQPSGRTVQETVEKALSLILRRPVAITGAGRTDAGVNARRMFAHLDLSDSETADTPRLLRSLNALCAPAVVVLQLLPVPETAHARFDATSRTYRYFVNTVRSPFTGRQSLYCRDLDFEAMNRAAAMLTAVDDFTSFAKLHSDARTNICRVSHAAWHQADSHRHYFEITADRFLRNMVRAVVGTLLEVGRGSLDPDGFAAVIGRRNRCAAGTSVPGEPLFLWDITYPYIDPDRLIQIPV